MNNSELYKDSDDILDVCYHFRRNLEFADSSWLNEFEALNLLQRQVEICKTIKELVKQEKYGEAFVLNRTVFENFFLISLILKGTIYELTYRVSSRNGETQKEAYERLAEELKKLMETKKDIVSFKSSQNYSKIKVVYKGLYSRDVKDRIIPIYYFIFNEYDPMHHRIDKLKSISSKEIFSELYEKLHQRHKALYQVFLGFTNLLDASILNSFITKEQRIRALVHYNFLSSFTHLTKKSIDLLEKADHNSPYGSRSTERARHLLTELNLLYIIRISRLLLLLFINFFSETEHRIKNRSNLVAYAEEIGKKYDYFWFIFNDPDEYDRWKYQTSKEYHRRYEGKLLDEKIPYYRDPYDRLEGQHTSTFELSTGSSYTSRWPI